MGFVHGVRRRSSDVRCAPVGRSVGSRTDGRCTSDRRHVTIRATAAGTRGADRQLGTDVTSAAEGRAVTNGSTSRGLSSDGTWTRVERSVSSGQTSRLLCTVGERSGTSQVIEAQALTTDRTQSMPVLLLQDKYRLASCTRVAFVRRRITQVMCRCHFRRAPRGSRRVPALSHDCAALRSRCARSRPCCATALTSCVPDPAIVSRATSVLRRVTFA